MEELVTAFDNLFSKDYNAFIRREMPEERFMNNFIFISPNFPENYWRFCAALRERGLRVLGVGDCPYDGLSEQLRCILDEYYYVSSLEHYDEVYGAVAYFAFKYGKPDWLESNNEYWLERDARLREDFNITSGFRPKDMPPVKLKSRMKERYRLAGISVARYCLADSYDTCRDFLREVGHAVVKPDNGVGANATYPISCEAELVTFFSGRHEGYIMEEYIDGTICSYDAIVDENGVPVFETGNVTPASLMDIVNERRESMFYIVKELPEKLREMGRAAGKEFRGKKPFHPFRVFPTKQRLRARKRRGLYCARSKYATLRRLFSRYDELRKCDRCLCALGGHDCRRAFSCADGQKMLLRLCRKTEWKALRSLP